MTPNPLRTRALKLLAAPLVLAATTLLGGTFGPRLLAVSDATNPVLKEYSDLLATAQAWYADDLGSERLVYSSISGMLDTLDPHSSFLEPEEYGAMQEKQRGSFYGLGIIIAKRNGRVTVITPVEGSPAQRLGIRAGDIIDLVEGQPIDDLPIDAVVKKLKGPKGTKVNITIVRPGLGEPLQMTVTRAEIPTNSVSFAFMVEPEVGYIRLKDFTHTSAPEVAEAWAKLEKQGMKKLVFDLRANPGGLLDQAIAVSDFFLRKGEKVVITRGRAAGSEQTFTAPGRNSRARIPVVVLINKGSASAAEIVAGAIQDQDRGIVAGQTSWGKGLVQSVYTLSEGAGLALTTAKYYTPSGRCIQRDYREFIEYVAPDDEEESNPLLAEDGVKRESYRTASGRVVYGGGGITPDVVVKADRLSRWMATLYARGVFFEWAVQYRASHPEVPRDFAVTDAVREDFFAHLDGRPNAPDVPARASWAAEKDKAVLDRALAEELVGAVHGPEAAYRLSIGGDVQLKKALTLFPEAEKLAGIGTTPEAIAKR
ncbi:MAG TPA: S41 family peptidase [Thermoanaerobaculia bacterium]|nr:S41 family peptidase [Thermoanaerobaculia bacterium]HQP88980.1 S41 family peptidase [Thermoanaerobaculia bacterium]